MLAGPFRASPWTVDLFGKPRTKYWLMEAVELASWEGLVLKIMTGLDDSLGKKGKATQSLHAVATHHKPNGSSYEEESLWQWIWIGRTRYSDRPVQFLFLYTALSS